MCHAEYTMNSIISIGYCGNVIAQLMEGMRVGNRIGDSMRNRTVRVSSDVIPHHIIAIVATSVQLRIAYSVRMILNFQDALRSASETVSGS